MPKCPNCGQETARTEDWVCQSCGYPLLSKSYRKIPKTYRQLQEEKPHKTYEQESSAREEPEPASEPEPEPAPQPEPAPEPEPEPEPESEPMLPEIEITAGEVLSAYEENGEAANAKFANKILRVTGIVKRIEAKDTLDIYYITLTDVEKTLLLIDVRCFFDRKHGPELNLLTPGKTVTVQGKYDGSMINIRMSNCFLVY